MFKKKESAEPVARRAVRSAAVARVDLIPPIVDIRRKENASIRLLMTGLVGLAVAVCVISLAVSFFANGAEGSLAAEKQRGTQLLLEQEKYAEVSGVKAQLLDSVTATMSALYSEADWARIMRELDATMPEDASITSEVVTVKGLTAASGSSSAQDTTGLDTAGVIQIEFTALAPVFDSPTPLLNALQSLTGYASAKVTAVAGENDEGYNVTGVVELNAAALGGTARVAALDQELLATLHDALEKAAVDPAAAAATAAATTAADEEDDLTSATE